MLPGPVRVLNNQAKFIQRRVFSTSTISRRSLATGSGRRGYTGIPGELVSALTLSTWPATHFRGTLDLPSWRCSTASGTPAAWERCRVECRPRLQDRIVALAYPLSFGRWGYSPGRILSFHPPAMKVSSTGPWTPSDAPRTIRTPCKVYCATSKKRLRKMECSAKKKFCPARPFRRD